MRRFAGARRFLFNMALATQKANCAEGGKFIGYVNMANRLPEWKKEFEWLKMSPFHTLQQALKDAERAFKNFFEKRAGFPRFKKKVVAKAFAIQTPGNLKSTKVIVASSPQSWAGCATAIVAIF